MSGDEASADAAVFKFLLELRMLEGNKTIAKFRSCLQNPFLHASTSKQRKKQSPPEKVVQQIESKEQYRPPSRKIQKAKSEKLMCDGVKPVEPKRQPEKIHILNVSVSPIIAEQSQNMMTQGLLPDEERRPKSKAKKSEKIERYPHFVKKNIVVDEHWEKVGVAKKKDQKQQDEVAQLPRPKVSDDPQLHEKLKNFVNETVAGDEWNGPMDGAQLCKCFSVLGIAVTLKKPKKRDSSVSKTRQRSADDTTLFKAVVEGMRVQEDDNDDDDAYDMVRDFFVRVVNEPDESAVHQVTIQRIRCAAMAKAGPGKREDVSDMRPEEPQPEMKISEEKLAEFRKRMHPPPVAVRTVIPGLETMSITDRERRLQERKTERLKEMRHSLQNEYYGTRSWRSEAPVLDDQTRQSIATMGARRKAEFIKDTEPTFHPVVTQYADYKKLSDVYKKKLGLRDNPDKPDLENMSIPEREKYFRERKRERLRKLEQERDESYAASLRENEAKRLKLAELNRQRVARSRASSSFCSQKHVLPSTDDILSEGQLASPGSWLEPSDDGSA